MYSGSRFGVSLDAEDREQWVQAASGGEIKAMSPSVIRLETANGGPERGCNVEAMADERGAQAEFEARRGSRDGQKGAASRCATSRSTQVDEAGSRVRQRYTQLSICTRLVQIMDVRASACDGVVAIVQTARWRKSEAPRPVGELRSRRQSGRRSARAQSAMIASRMSGVCNR